MPKSKFTTNYLRELFLKFFEAKEHFLVESSPLVPKEDPTLLFTNAGMNQFKAAFLGKEVRPYSKATSVQRCMRVSGKHNDLEMVGYTARHHTFFEMLGNFSFGDYFKREAIAYAWEFLTQELKIDPKRLWVTVYKDDKEAEKIWLQELKIDPKRFSRCGEKDNFWAMGETGPCGPCSEIFYDHGKELAGGPPGSKDEDGDRYVEIWNLVFMQYERQADGKLLPLPKPSVDTGMGLERLAAVMQGVHDNYDTDVFVSLINAISKLINVKDKQAKGMRVIADHIRAATFLIADGIVPSNEGRGYVLRRIIRRAIRHAHQLGVQELFLHKLVSAVVAEMGGAYPQLMTKQDFIAKVIEREEEQFATTLEQGLQILEQEISCLAANTIPGEVVFKLYDTYGFPADLTADIARERGLTIDQAGFEEKMATQRTNSREASKFAVDYTQALQLAGETEFIGYENAHSECKIIGLFQNGQQRSKLSVGEEGAVVLNHTPFYAEAGGQIGDKGEIYTSKGCFQVVDTQKQGALYVHYGIMQKGGFSAGEQVTAEVGQLRAQIARNHSATHLLHAALRQILGSHVEQKGSLVDAERLRFDFSHFEALTAKQLQAIERTVNQQIRNNLPVLTEVMSQQEAKKSGAMALFGEKYGAAVRVVSMGQASKELCAGTHVAATGEIGLLKVISETGIAAGVRRLEAVTGDVAFEYLLELELRIQGVAAILKTDPARVNERLQLVLKEAKQREKELSKLKASLASSVGQDLATTAVAVKGVKVISKVVPGLDRQALRSAVDRLKQQAAEIVVLATIADGEILLVVGTNKQYSSAFSADLLLKYIVEITGGKGGGRADMAQGGGGKVEVLEQALAAVPEWVASQTK